MFEYIEYLIEVHSDEWHREVTSNAPHWAGALALHLRLVELEHLDDALKDLLR